MGTGNFLLFPSWLIHVRWVLVHLCRACRTLRSADAYSRSAGPVCWPGHLPLVSVAPFGSTTRLRPGVLALILVAILVMILVVPRSVRGQGSGLGSGQGFGWPIVTAAAHSWLGRLVGANAAVCRRVLAVGRTGLLAGSSSACLGRALRKYDAASSGCPCPHPRRYPCHDPCRSPVRQRTRIGIRIGTRIRMAHRHCRRPFLARSSCRGQRQRFAVRVLAHRQQRPCWRLFPFRLTGEPP